MADTKLTALSAITTLSADDLLYVVDDPGGTPTSAKITALNAFGFVWGAAEISVTGTVTATIGRMHVCSGTSADYTVTLPAASGNTGKLIGFRMAGIAALSKFVTLDGNASETIDGATTRVMWAAESCILLCDGSNWFKIAGKSIPMMAKILRSTAMAVAIATATVTKVTLATSIYDNTGAMADTANNQIVIRRSGKYTAIGVLVYDNLAATANASTRIHKNATVVVATTIAYSGASWYPASLAALTEDFAVSDTVDLRAYQASGGNANIYPDTVNWLSVVEAPTW